MKKNEQLAEKPNHEHYMVCRTRKAEIDRFSKKVFVYTSIECAVMICMTLAGINIGAFSWFPSLCGGGDPFNINYIILQSVEITAMFIFGILGQVVNKIFDVIIFAVNCIIIISCLFAGIGSFYVFLPFVMGIVAILLTFPSINAYLDYRQLSETEGFPNFSDILAYAEDNAEYKSYYFERSKNKIDEDEEMPIPTETVKQEFSQSKSAHMDDI
ncbi:MAG: hypothetical protein K2K91_03365 [Ruminococcus sp.]|nr:hypothetical protein [Ruminococcus sp.]MDE7099365.1 hypothetical protein [Ruminococcus sp.]